MAPDDVFLMKDDCQNNLEPVAVSNGCTPALVHHQALQHEPEPAAQAGFHYQAR